MTSGGEKGFYLAYTLLDLQHITDRSQGIKLNYDRNPEAGAKQIPWRNAA